MKNKIITLILLVAGIALLGGCSVNIGGNAVRGSGSMVTRSMDVGNDFSAISISGNFQIIYRQSPERGMTVVMQENLFQYLTRIETSDTLFVGSSRGFNTTSENRPRLYIYAPYLTAADLSGAVSANGWDVVEGQRFALNISGAAGVNITLDVERIDVDVSGAASITLDGTADILNILGSGALTVSAGDLTIESGRVDLSGAGTVTLSSLANVTINTSGAARVREAG
ncbi:MAG: DUF2807 domain-containing protein [Defluviitaleaceae bacterium]|nr:DUF2807 domain-containing protein [Defluviitaleaceae bacterium]